MNQTATISAPTIEHDGRTHRMFFVRGRMRSGTNWICNLLNLHPQINCQGEFHFERLHEGFRLFMSGAEYSIGSDVAAAAQLSYLDTIKRCIATRVARKPGALWLGDRTPARIDNWCPSVPVIHTTRDGRDAVVSWLLHAAVRAEREGRQTMIDWLSMVAARHGLKPVPGAEDWFDAYLADPQIFERKPYRLVEHTQLVMLAAKEWHDHVSDDIRAISRVHLGEWDIPLHCVRYEDLHRDTESARRGLYEFLDLDPDEALPLSQETGTLPGSANGYGRGNAAVGSWKQCFTDEAKDVLKMEAGELLVELGYEQDMNW